MSQEKIITQTELLCRTCRFASKCHIVKLINEHIDAAEQGAFERMGVDLDLVPVVTYCPKYQKHPELIRRQLADSDGLGEDIEEEEEE